MRIHVSGQKTAILICLVNQIKRSGCHAKKLVLLTLATFRKFRVEKDKLFGLRKISVL